MVFNDNLNNLPRRPSYHQASSHHAPFRLVARQDTLHQVYQNVSSLLANLHPTLFDGGEHRIASHGTLAVGESADGDIVRHTEPHALGSI